MCEQSQLKVSTFVTIKKITMLFNYKQTFKSITNNKQFSLWISKSL